MAGRTVTGRTHSRGVQDAIPLWTELLAGAVGLAVATGGPLAAGPASAALPAVDMEALIKAAQEYQRSR